MKNNIDPFDIATYTILVLSVITLAVMSSFIFWDGLLMGNVFPAFTFGIPLSLAWWGLVNTKGLFIPDQAELKRRANASLGFFFLLTGIVISVLGPNYFATTPGKTDWFVMMGLFLSAQVGLSLLLVVPLRRLSFTSGFLVSAIILHSVILQYPNEFTNILSAKALVVISLMLATWFLGQAIFFEFSEPPIYESKNIKYAKLTVAVLSGLLAIIEFINIIYTLFTFRIP